MKISKIIDELTELKKYIGDKDLEACIANNITAGVNVMYADNGGITSTSLEGEKIARQLKETTSEHNDDLDEIELTEEEIDKYIPYRNEIQDILEKEGLAENRTNSSGEEQLVQVSTAEEIFSAGCEYVLKLIKKNGELK